MKSLTVIARVLLSVCLVVLSPNAQAVGLPSAAPPPSISQPGPTVNDLTPTVPTAPNPVISDITTVTHTTMDIPSMHTGNSQKDAQMQSIMDKFSYSTTYMSGHKMRVESAMFTIISDMDAGKMWMLNPTKQTYTVTTYTPEQMKTMMKTMLKSPSAGGDGMTYKVNDTGRTTMILGHVARHYIVTMHMTVMGSPMDMVDDILAAQDITLPYYTEMSGGLTEIKGMPLVTSIKATGGPTGSMNMKMTVTSISTDPIPASKFQVPDGYTQTQAPDYTKMVPH
jgi:hypothetical protein